MIASQIIMIRPSAFTYNPETEESNGFQFSGAFLGTEVGQKALHEFENLAQKLAAAGIDVKIFNDTAIPAKPDAVFPNNWFSTHSDGKVFLYPMLSPLRRAERRADIINWLLQTFDVKQQIDLTEAEIENRFLEGTGSMVMDHEQRVIYACLSSRTELELLRQVAHKLNYALQSFCADDRNGKPIYHTNVVMSIAEDWAVICLDCMTERKEEVIKTLGATEKEIIEISFEQMENFCGNILMLQNSEGQKFTVMSERAHSFFTPKQLSSIEKSSNILSSDLTTIEKVGGGSARCMLTEIFLSEKSTQHSSIP